MKTSIGVDAGIFDAFQRLKKATSQAATAAKQEAVAVIKPTVLHDEHGNVIYVFQAP